MGFQLAVVILQQLRLIPAPYEQEDKIKGASCRPTTRNVADAVRDFASRPPSCLCFRLREASGKNETFRASHPCLGD